MPEAAQIAANKDAVQMLFWFVIAMGSGIAGSVVWIAKYLILPWRDEHFRLVGVVEQYLHQEQETHRKLVSAVESTKSTIEDMRAKIRCPVLPDAGRSSVQLPPGNPGMITAVGTA